LPGVDRAKAGVVDKIGPMTLNASTR
jgi:hypothetical protein